MMKVGDKFMDSKNVRDILRIKHAIRQIMPNIDPLHRIYDGRETYHIVFDVPYLSVGRIIADRTELRQLTRRWVLRPLTRDLQPMPTNSTIVLRHMNTPGALALAVRDVFEEWRQLIDGEKVVDVFHMPNTTDGTCDADDSDDTDDYAVRSID